MCKSFLAHKAEQNKNCVRNRCRWLLYYCIQVFWCVADSQFGGACVNELAGRSTQTKKNSVHLVITSYVYCVLFAHNEDVSSSLDFMEHERSLLCAQEATTCPSHETDQSTPQDRYKYVVSSHLCLVFAVGSLRFQPKFRITFSCSPCCAHGLFFTYSWTWSAQ